MSIRFTQRSYNALEKAFQAMAQAAPDAVKHTKKGFLVEKPLLSGATLTIRQEFPRSGNIFIGKDVHFEKVPSYSVSLRRPDRVDLSTKQAPSDFDVKDISRSSYTIGPEARRRLDSKFRLTRDERFPVQAKLNTEDAAIEPTSYTTWLKKGHEEGFVTTHRTAKIGEQYVGQEKTRMNPTSGIKTYKQRSFTESSGTDAYPDGYVKKRTKRTNFTPMSGTGEIIPDTKVTSKIVTTDGKISRAIESYMDT
jgi:hypothetical protein